MFSHSESWLNIRKFGVYKLTREDCIRGKVTRLESKDIFIFSEEHGTQIRASLKGKFKKDFRLKKDKLTNTDIVAVGDNVLFDLIAPGSGVVTEILPRRNFLSRKAPRMRGATRRGERLEQVVASNIDKFFIVTSVFEPSFNNKSLDRFIVAGESNNIPVSIIINKTDLDEEDLITEFAELYTSLGYPVFRCSVLTNTGIQAIKNACKGLSCVFWGHSGVGKSSLLNVLFPELDASTGEISYYTGKGKHTTVTVTGYRVEDNTTVIDTPGIREIDPYGIQENDLVHYFHEFAPFAEHCRINTCLHNNEPLCKVREAAEQEKISPYRYDSYLRLLETIEEDINF